MRIGIMTWFFGSNYGAKAQAYALQKTIESLGHECLMVDYKPSNYEKVNLKMNINLESPWLHPILFFNCLKRNHSFKKTNKIYKLTRKVNDAEEIDNLRLDALVFGSDAIYNISHPLYNPLYMGVGIRNTTKIAYSPSCEYLNPQFQLSSEEKESILEYTNISVRDINTKELLKHNCGIDVTITVDPTLLYSFNDIKTTWSEKNYLLMYTFSPWDQYEDKVKCIAKEKGLSIVSIGKYCKWADINYDYASFAEWISAFRNAKYVFTDSFHGTVFAIKNSKELILCSREDKRAKIQSLLNDVGIKRGFYEGENTLNEYIKQSEIDYREVEKKLSVLVNKSLEYLQVSLTKCK